VNSRFSAAIGEVCLESLARGGINVGAGEIASEGERKSLGVCNGEFWTERGSECGAANGRVGGRRRPFIENLRIDVSLDAAGTDLMTYTCLHG
jgi:hypothetical protein